MNLSRQAVRQEPQLDLIVWPETMFRVPYHTMSPDHVSPRDSKMSTESLCEHSRAWIEATVHELGDYPMLIGLDAINHTRDGQDSYNAALFADRDGKCLGCYHKMHLVMFGEYVPLAGYFPWLYALTPLSGGATPGAGPHATTVGDVRYAPNICYESTVPHLICDQVNQLRDESREPDILVNLTNDGWFRGSSALDMHLICGVFRAVECRKPFLVAANTGFSAWIDSDGRIRAQGPRRETDVVIARPRLDSRRAPYLVYGDTLAGACLAACGVLALVGLWQSESVGRVFYRLRRASNS
jgi:apolipoprotein N-acyltransferase